MRIHEAIKQAGKGGKYRRPHWDDNVYNTFNALGIMVYQNDNEAHIKMDDFLADDWEVVESKPIIGCRKATMEDCQVCNEPPDCGVKGSACNIQLTPVHDAVKEAMDKSEPTTFDTSDMPPVLEVGDKITVTGDSRIKSNIICHVTEIREDGQVGFRPLTTHFLGKEDVAKRVELFEKGAKVHDYGRVEITDKRFMSIQTRYPMPPDGNYRLTATAIEDASDA